jgi:cytoskeletal protein CcmA (bactofilin family)
MADNSEKQTLVEEGTEFSGTLKAKCKVVVRGAVDGELVAPALDVTDTGTVTGNVKAKSVRSRGVISGSVDADEISLAGQVRSSTVIRAKSLEVRLASDKGKLEVTFGDCVLDVGDMPTDEIRVAEEQSDEKKPKTRKTKNGKAPEMVAEEPPAEPDTSAPAPAE